MGFSNLVSRVVRGNSHAVRHRRDGIFNKVCLLYFDVVWKRFGQLLIGEVKKRILCVILHTLDYCIKLCTTEKLILNKKTSRVIRCYYSKPKIVTFTWCLTGQKCCYLTIKYLRRRKIIHKLLYICFKKRTKDKKRQTNYTVLLSDWVYLSN